MSRLVTVEYKVAANRMLVGYISTACIQQTQYDIDIPSLPSNASVVTIYSSPTVSYSSKYKHHRY